MKKHLKTVISHPLISGSGIVFIGSFTASIGNYFYNLLMGRFLSVEDYGLLVSLTSVLVLLGLFSNSFTNVFVKYSAQYKSSQNEGKMSYLFRFSTKTLSIIGLIILLLSFVLVPLLQKLLTVPNSLYLVLIILSVVCSLFLTLPLGILQGRMQFVALSFANISQPLVKIVTVLLFLSLGFAVLSPFLAIGLSVFIPLVILYIYMIRRYGRDTSVVTDGKPFKKEFFTYSFTFFLTGVGIALLSNTDILLVRYFFSEAISGQYAALSLMGKAILYLVTPINLAFFPIIAYKREKKERLFGTVLLTFGLVSIAALSLSFIYFSFPSLILKIFFPSPEFASVGKYLGIYSLYIYLFTLATLLSSFFLSIGKTKVYKISLTAAFIQITLIILFHNSLQHVIYSLFAASLLFFIMLLVYYIKHGKD